MEHCTLLYDGYDEWIDKFRKPLYQGAVSPCATQPLYSFLQDSPGFCKTHLVYY